MVGLDSLCWGKGLEVMQVCIKLKAKQADRLILSVADRCILFAAPDTAD